MGLRYITAGYEASRAKGVVVKDINKEKSLAIKLTT